MISYTVAFSHILVTDGFYTVFFYLKPTENYKVRGREVEERGSEKQQTEKKKTKKKKKTECWERLGNPNAGLGQA